MFAFVRDCRTATLQVEQARDQGLAWGPRLRLWLHLLSCPHCRRYARQSRLLEDPARPLAPEDAVLTRQARQRLQELLREHRFRGFPVVNESREATLLGYISRTELQYALDSATAASRSLPVTTQCYFQHQPLADPTVTLDLRPWMDQTPITLSSRSSLQLTNDMFQKLGLRYIAFVNRGILAGLLTKKDLWFVLNEGEEGKIGHGVGVLREGISEREDERGLLGHTRDRSMAESIASRDGEG